eukprot:TRINITY_DN15931_c0_g1_i1.p1 TRINITY_DN15931_c0_g1~~TRINITY_DN15931_c0_g1_i1.p1  ORF type:complete len:212 (-),score=31.42 TRINITY_DN15931_c0_g1_i1:110-745(-)
MEEFDCFYSHPITEQPFRDFYTHYKAARCSPSHWTHNFVLGTVDSEDQPHARTVSLHTFDNRGFCFCSNYDGPKASQLEHCPKASMLFVWEDMKMTVRICGQVEKLSSEESDILFDRCGPSEKFYYTYCSQGKDHPYSQSQVYTSPKEMQQYKEDLKDSLDTQEWVRPASWGGFRLVPTSFEFLSLKMRGNEARVLWKKEEGEWRKYFLAP